MKRLLSLTLCFAVLCSLLAGCGNSSTPNNTSGNTSAPAEKTTITLRIGSGHAESNPWIQAVEDFFVTEISKRVSERTNCEINWVKSYGGSVISLGNELEGTRDGLVDIACVILAFEASRLPLEAMAYSAPFACSDPAIAATVLHQMLDEFPEFSSDFEKYNQKLLGMGISDQYGLFSTSHVTKLDDLAGVRIGAAGLNLSWIEGSGAIGVQTSLNDTYQNLQTNVCGATIQPTHSCVNMMIYEVAPYYLDTNFNVISPFNALTVNLDTWNNLPAEVQEIISEVGGEYLDYEAAYIATVHEQDLNISKENNCTIDELDWDGKVEWASKLEDTVAVLVRTLNDAGYDGSKILNRYYELLAENGLKSVRDWAIN
jgi:TRAP-type C4-dicarboxylate transport system substrate-binding protein